MRRTLVAGVLLALATCPQYAGARGFSDDGPRRSDAGPTARAAAVATRAALRGLRDAGELDPAAYAARLAEYDAAQQALGRLTGLRRSELRGVVSDLDRLAVAGQLTAPRVALTFETLRRNTAWWTREAVVPVGRRVRFAPSQLVWQRYAGHGLQVQWLGTFGRANALWQLGEDAQLGALLDEAAALAVPRAGGIAWESDFPFSGARAPWVSGMSTATALTAYARGAIRLRRPGLFATARAALGVFEAPPPEGVRLPAGAGAHYLLYSSRPDLRVGNAFVQSLNGLRDLAVYATDPRAAALFATGEARLREELPRYDTGAWSRYALGRRESDLGYHRLFRDVLQGLCRRVSDDERRTQAAPDPAPYCSGARRFTQDLTTPPAVVLEPASGRPRARVAVRVPYALSKVSTVAVRVTRDGRPVTAGVARRGAGRHTVTFTPRLPGGHVVEVRAVDLAGNATRTALSVRVAPAARR